MSQEQPSGDSTVQELDEGTASGEQQVDELDGEELENEQPELDDEELEEEIDGLKVRGKKEAIERLKGERLMQADYTRKTQEAAEIRKAAEAEREMAQQARQFEQANLDIVADIRAMDRELAHLQQVNIHQLSDQDPIQAQKLMARMQQLQTGRGQAAHALAQRQQHFQQVQQQEAARHLAEGSRVLQREIPGWGAEMAAKLTEYGRSRGYSDAMLASVSQPQFVIDLYRSMQYDEARKKAVQKPKQSQEKPVTRVQGSSKAKGVIDPDKLSVEDWLKHRNSQVRARR